jgi:hypothetical protein
MSEYFGKLEELKGDEVYKFNNDILKEANRNGTIPVLLFFWKKYQRYPRTLEAPYDSQPYVPYSLTKKLLQDKYQHNTDNDLISYFHNNIHKLSYASTLVLDITDGVIVHFYGGQLCGGLDGEDKVEYAVEESKLYHVFTGYKIYFLPGKEDFVQEFLKNLTFLKYKEVVPEACLQMICKNQYGFYLTSIKIKKPIISDMKLHYGEEFEKVHETILNGLKEESAHGLILLHGLPGSGKTHYIRYLIQEITDKQLIYVPPDMTASISSPDFLPFMLQNTNSILIIEDAENIIKSRDSKESTTQAVANLLNLSDGLLGDSLHQPIIATFNCELNSIDSALLRKGRLISQYEFGKLSIENGQKLSDQLGFTSKITEPMTLADIYGQEK